MAHTTIFDLGTSTMVQGNAEGTAARVHRHNDGVTGVKVDGWSVYIGPEGITVRRLDEPHRNIGAVWTDDEIAGQALRITAGGCSNDVWPSSATTFATGERKLAGDI